MLADRQQDRILHLPGLGARTLLGPVLAALPERLAAVHELAVVDAVARAPLLLEVDQTSVGDDALVARRGGLEPVGEVSSIARAAGSHPGAGAGGVTLDGPVGRLIQLVARTFQK